MEEEELGDLGSMLFMWSELESGEDPMPMRRIVRLAPEVGEKRRSRICF